MGGTEFFEDEGVENLHHLGEVGQATGPGVPEVLAPGEPERGRAGVDREKKRPYPSTPRPWQQLFGPLRARYD